MERMCQGKSSTGASRGRGAAPYVMGDIVEKAATPVEGFFRGYTLIGAIMFTGGLIAMLFIRPERAAERLRQDGMQVPLPAPGLAR
jgi:hypothetical protein